MGHIEVVHESLHIEPPAIPPRTIARILFGISGRIRRRTFLLSEILALLVFGFPSLMFFVYGMSGKLERSEFAFPISLSALLFVLVGAWSVFFALPIKRLHDTNRTAYWVIANFVGVLFIPLFLYLILKDGTRGANDYGIDPKGRETTGLHEFTALMAAAKAGDLETIQALISAGVDINKQDVKGATALMYAVLGNNPVAVNALLVGGARADISTNKGLTPLRVATNNNLTEIEELLADRRRPPGIE